jgi:Fe-S-cluster containining protein
MDARTLGQFVEQEHVLDDLAAMIAEINNRAGRESKRLGKVSCLTCTATKACCSSLVVARFYEGIVVAAQLRSESRDTPELRAQLAAAAAEMEAADPYGWRKPCVFLDQRERCTIYASRPTPCGILYVYSPAAVCSEPLAQIRAYVPDAERAVAFELEEKFRERLSLRKKIGRRYIGVLPRMVLLALEMWDRTDFRDALRAQPWPTDAEAARWDSRSAVNLDE